MLQVIKVGKPSASWKPQHLVLFYASSINLLKTVSNVISPPGSMFRTLWLSGLLPWDLWCHVCHSGWAAQSFRGEILRRHPLVEGG